MQKKIRILHLEDTESDADLVKRVLMRANLSFELLWVTNALSYATALTEFHPDIVLSDHALPGFNSQQALKLLSDTGIDVPFIIVTSAISEEFAVGIIKNGAEDYILKDRMQRLPAAIEAAIEKHDAAVQRRASRASLRKSEANLTAIIENTDAYIYSLDLDLNYITFNTALKEIMKATYGVEIAPGMKVFGFLGPDDKTEVEFWIQTYKQVLDGNPQQFVKNYSTATTRVYISFSVRPIYENNNISGVCCLSRNISVQYLAEEERGAMMEQLIKLDNDLLQFSFIASHNMRGPVASMMGIMNLINETCDNVVELLPHLKSSISQLDRVTQDISETLNIKMSPIRTKETVSLISSLREIEQLVQEQLSECGGKILTDNFDLNFTTIRSYFHNILYNLIVNAIKFRSPDRQLKITVHATRNDGSYEIVISDNGLGIDLDKYGSKVFGLYHKFHGEIDGRGLGLFITKIQTEAMNGTIEIDSVVNEGTKFRIKFPWGSS